MRVVIRRFLFRKRVLIPLGAGVGLMLLAWFVLLPWVVRGRVHAILHQLELGDATFRVTRATPWSSTVRDIDAGDGNRIDELRVTYSIEGLWNRHVDNIRIDGLQLTVDVREGGASIKPLEAMMRAAPAASQPAARADEGEAAASDWPFRSVRVVDSMLIIRTHQRVIDAPLNATLRWPELHADVAGLTIDGAIGDPDATNLRFSGDGIEGEDLTAVLRAVAPDVPVAISADVRINGRWDRTGETTSLDARIIAAADADEPADSTEKIAGTNVSFVKGVFEIAATVSGAARSLKLAAKDVTLAESSLGATATGVSADVVFDNRMHTTTKPAQVVRVEKLSASKVELTDAVVRFEFAPGGTLHVIEARGDFLGGVVSAEDVRVTPGQPIPVTLAVANIELGELLELLAQGKATGEGKVNGRLPLVIAPDGSVQFAEGAAQAKAGGTLRVLDTAALESIAGAASGASTDPTQAPQAQVRQNIVAALKDFQYRSLTAQLKHEPEMGLVAYVRMTGKGTTGAEQALHYDLRVTGLEELLRSAIGVHRTVTREAARQ